MSAQSFINEIMSGAIQIQFSTGLPAAAMIAEAADETGWGADVTVDMNTGKNSYNLFNVKGIGPAGSVNAETEEEVNGVMVPQVAQFRAYYNYQQSFADYAAVITGQLNFAPAVAVDSDPVAYVTQLQACGYATDENYATTLIAIMTENDLIDQVEEAIELSLFTTDALGNVIKVGAVPAYSTEAVANALRLGLISQTHNPQEIPTLGEILTILLNAKNKGISL